MFFDYENNSYVPSKIVTTCLARIAAFWRPQPSYLCASAKALIHSNYWQNYYYRKNCCSCSWILWNEKLTMKIWLGNCNRDCVSASIKALKSYNWQNTRISIKKLISLCTILILLVYISRRKTPAWSTMIWARRSRSISIKIIKLWKNHGFINHCKTTSH